MGRVSRDARLTFIEIWTLADDSGRLRGDSRLLASLLFPYDDDAKDLIDTWLGELVAQDCIVRYSVDGKDYVAVKNWGDHQKIDKPSPSKLPPAPLNSVVPLEVSIPLANPREGSDNVREDSIRIKDQGVDQGKDQGVDLTRAHTHEDTPTTGGLVVLQDAWSRFLAAYPKRAGGNRTGTAKERFANLVKSGTDPESIIAGAERYRDYCKAAGKVGTEMVQQMATFLGQARGWEEEFEVPKAKSGLGLAAEAAQELFGEGKAS